MELCHFVMVRPIQVAGAFAAFNNEPGFPQHPETLGDSRSSHLRERVAIVVAGSSSDETSRRISR